ncbi:MAG: hypothetical protein AAGA61_03575 [Pseudomonadota bacterium]
MRGLALLIMLASTLAYAAREEYVETRELRLDTEGVSVLRIEAGAGNLTVTGDPGADGIVVTATIAVPGDESAARRRIDERLVLTLERVDDVAELDGYFESGLFGWGQAASVALSVSVPQALDLNVVDASGGLEILAIGGDVIIEDGSGGIRVFDSGGHIEIEDGSGGIRVEGVAGNVRIADGSGSMTIERISGSVFIEDGSGSIRVADVQQDLIVEDKGSGGVDFERVLGRVDIDE